MFLLAANGARAAAAPTQWEVRMGAQRILLWLVGADAAAGEARLMARTDVVHLAAAPSAALCRQLLRAHAFGAGVQRGRDVVMLSVSERLASLDVAGLGQLLQRMAGDAQRWAAWLLAETSVQPIPPWSESPDSVDARAQRERYVDLLKALAVHARIDAQLLAQHEEIVIDRQVVVLRQARDALECLCEAGPLPQPAPAALLQLLLQANLLGRPTQCATLGLVQGLVPGRDVLVLAQRVPLDAPAAVVARACRDVAGMALIWAGVLAQSPMAAPQSRPGAVPRCTNLEGLA